MQTWRSDAETFSGSFTNAHILEYLSIKAWPAYHVKILQVGVLPCKVVSAALLFQRMTSGFCLLWVSCKKWMWRNQRNLILLHFISRMHFVSHCYPQIFQLSVKEILQGTLGNNFKRPLIHPFSRARDSFTWIPAAAAGPMSTSASCLLKMFLKLRQQLGVKCRAVNPGYCVHVCM